MIPLRDDAPRFSYPAVTLVLVLLNVAVFLYQVYLSLVSAQAQMVFVETFGAIPLRAGYALAGQYPLVEGVAPVFTSIFLHGGWLHLIGNMWFLWIFGDNIEDELGHFPHPDVLRRLRSAGVGGSRGGEPASTVPAVGASGAIAGVMGAYMVRFPRARIVTLVPIFFFFTTIEIPAVLMLFYWFAIQFFSGAASFAAGSSGGVAWWAHVGGFVAGAALIWSRPRRRRYRRVYSY